VHGGRQIIAVWPGFRERVYGIAVDVGSTTIAAHLCDLASGEVVAASGAMNPQIRFGEDLMSRVSWVMMNPAARPTHRDRARAAINALTADVAKQAGIAPDDILEATFVGNPIMHHLLLGISRSSSAARRLRSPRFVADAVGHRNRPRDPSQRAHLRVAMHRRHVGADAAGVVLAEGPICRRRVTLLVDIGTNAEIVLGNRKRLLACSSPTGPRSRARRSVAGSARRRCDRARAHRPRHARAAHSR
jgi:uncharacterized 2Fe-2S/4Fe-4S cluster protein (DUF4445 family)